MGLFDQFPYTNFHELNLDWILEALRVLEHTIDQFVSINALKYADPIQWNITRQYEKNTIVIDPLTGTAYISVQPVPAGVALTREEYWTVVFDLGSFVVRAAKNFTDHWESQWTLTATFPSNAGDWLVWNDTLFKVMSNIIAGDQYVIGSNIEHFTMEDVIGHLENLNTTDKSSLVAAINETWTAIGTTITTIVGNLEDLNTTDKSNLVAAINETWTAIGTTFNEIVGNLEDLNTTDKSTVVAAINETYTSLGNLRGQVDAECLNNKKVVIIGESNAWYLNSYNTLQSRYNCSVESLAVGSTDFPTVFTDSLVDQVQNIQTADPDLIIVWGGTNGLTRLINDITLADSGVGNMDLEIDNTGSYDTTTEFGAMNYCLDYLTSNYPNAVIIGIIRPDYPTSHQSAFYQDEWFSMIYQVYHKYGVRVLDLNAVAELDTNNADNLTKWWIDAGIHLNSDFWAMRGAQLINSLYADKALSNSREIAGYIMPSTIFSSDANTINSLLKTRIGKDPITFNCTIKTINPVHGVFNLGGYSSGTSFSLIRYSVSGLYVYTSPNTTRNCILINNPTANSIYDLSDGVYQINLNNSNMTGLPEAIGGILSIFANNPAYPNNKAALFITNTHNVYMATVQSDTQTSQWYNWNQVSNPDINEVTSIYGLGFGIFQINLNNNTLTGLPEATGGILWIYTNNPAYPNNRIGLFVTTSHNIYMGTIQADTQTSQWYKATMTSV